MGDYNPRDQIQNILPPEELQMMRKCASGSLWTHSLPAATLSFIGCNFIKNKGYAINPWATCGVVAFSFIAGRMVAIPGCMRETVRQYPEGALAKMLEASKDKRPRVSAPNRSIQEAEESDPLISGINDPEPSYQTPQSSVPSSSPLVQSPQTYDDLRRRNREQYTHGRMSTRSHADPSAAPLTQHPVEQPPSSNLFSNDLYPSTSTYYDPPSVYNDHEPAVSSTPEDEPRVTRRKRVNKYGDEIED